MEEYLDVQAPQWVDFAENCSPQVPIKDFFNKVHTMHERMDEFCDSIPKDIEDVQPTLQTNVSCTNTKVQEDLDVMKSTPIKLIPPKYNQKIVIEEPALQTDILCVNTNVQKDLDIIKSTPVKVTSPIYHNNEMIIGELTLQTDVLCVNTKAQEDLNIIKSTPVKVISPKYRNNKEMVVEETTYDQVLSDAMRKLELCTKPLKRRDVNNSNKTTQESNVFKTPSMAKLTKSSKSIGCRSVQNKHVQPVQNSISKSAKVNRNLCTPSNVAINTKRIVGCSLFKQNEDCVENYTSKIPIDSVDSKDKDCKEYKECSKEDNEESKQENSEEYKEGGSEKCKEEDSEEYKEEDSEECKEEDNDEHKKEDHDGHKEDEMHKEQDNINSQDEPKETMDNNKDKEEDNNDDKKEDNKDDKEEDNQDDMDIAFVKDNQRQSNKHVAVLTWHNHRRSMYKRRVSVNKQFVSLAEAVSRFQNETPKRFRTRSNKDNNATTSINMSKLIQNRIKPTVPVSPALVSKNRTRAVTVLSQEEREMQEMKKHPIKANPIPRNVLRGPRAVKKTSSVVKNPTEVTNTFSTIQSNENACTTNSLQSKNSLSLLQPSYHDKALSGHKNMVPKVLVTNPSGIIVEREEISFFGVPKDTGAAKTVTRVVPFSFEARNKDLQMKKEQRLKSLQSKNSKTEFHARPAPNFSKPTPQIKQQQQQQQQEQQQQQQQKQNTKKPVRMSVLPCPFSFEERNKQMAKRKEQMMKQVLENKQMRMFRANPVPVFKPVMVRSTSKERLLAKDNNMKTENEHSDKCENQENREPNVNFSKEQKPLNFSKEKKNMQKTKSIDDIVDKQKVPLKDKIYPLELNTDKRARERREYDEKIKRKEMEEETKHQEEEKKRLEHLKQMQIELRKQAEVKARPMPVFKPPIAIKATKQLTIPQSPSFKSKLKSKQA